MPRYLGQHYLINKAAVGKIIAALDLRQNDAVVEIGPGEGALTLPLAEKCLEISCKLIAIEKDARLAKQIAKRLPQIEVRTADILKILPALSNDKQLAPGYKLCGNIPYYVTGKLLRILSEIEEKPGLIVLTIQKEVAERLIAAPPKMNLLAAATQIWAKPRIIGFLKPRDFQPPPEVESAILKLEIEPKIKEKSALERYYRLIKSLFKQPRKTILNNLSTGLDISKEKALEIIKNLGLTGQERPQNLDLKMLLEISQKLFTF